MEQTTEQAMREDPRAWNDSRERRAVAPAPVATVVNKASTGEKWREARPSKKVVFGMLVAAAVLTMIVGFNWGGWVSGDTAQKSAVKGAQAAVVLRLAPICVAQANLDPQSASKLAELKAIPNSYDRPKYIKEQGWATMPGEKAPDNAVADACTKLLMGS